MTEISLIFPELDPAQFEPLVDALRAQPFTNFELVVVDADHERNRERYSQEAGDRFISLRHAGVGIPSPTNEQRCDVGFVASTGRVIVIAEPGHSLPDLRAVARLAAVEKTGVVDGTFFGTRQAVIERRGESLAKYRIAELDPAGKLNPRGAVATARRRRIVMVYGEFSSAGHGPYDMDGLYERTGLTGSEGSFFNLARTLSERGHEVAVFCDVREPQKHESGFAALPIEAVGQLPRLEKIDAVIAWNEPDYLRHAPPGAVRICDQQLNDFGYCRVPGWERLVDQWVSPSANHRTNVMGGREPCVVIPNSVDLGMFEKARGNVARNPRRMVWCSSPDRGLHRLLDVWPLVRAAVPEAELKIFYKLRPWIDRVHEANDEMGRRARFIDEALLRLSGCGVEVVDLVPSARMAAELWGAAVLAYPCDPVRYTEGFGCSVLDACAAGCLPIISHVDALPEVHGSAARIVVAGDREQWAAAVVAALTVPIGEEERIAMRAHAERHARERVTSQWEALLTALRP